MLGALPRLEGPPAALDEFAKAAAEPGDRDLALRHEGREQLRPLALVAVKSPALDQLGAGIFVVRVHLAPPHGCSCLSMRPINTVRNWRLPRCWPACKRSGMKAIVIHEYGPPDVLRYEDVPDPAPRAGEIRIRVHAATVNRVLDVSLRAGKEGARGPTLPLIPGVDCAGVGRCGRSRRCALAQGNAGRRRRRHAARYLRRGRRGLPRTDGHDGHQAAGRLRRAGRGAGLRRDRAARPARLSPRRRGHAPRADRLEPAVQRRRAQGRRDRADHGRRRQSRHRSASRSPRT